jgi:hypothetical protein
MIVVTGLISAEGWGQTTSEFFDEADAFFNTYVSEGKVNYKGISDDPAHLNSLMKKAAKIKVSKSKPSTYKAFWINTYNLAVIRGIVDNYPLNSPLDVKGFFDTIRYDLGGKSLTLNDIENKELRGVFDEPRFHFVLVCGALGCPPIVSKAYTPAGLEQQLEQQTRSALNDAVFVQVSEDKVGLSEIFKWYREDFTKNGQTELDFINSFRKEAIPANAEIFYYPYNWKLNSK